MAEILCSVLADGDPESVFDFIADPDQRSLWQRDVQRHSEPMPELVTGASWTEVRRLGWHELRIHVTVTDSNRPGLIAFAGDAGPFRGQGRFEIRPEGSRTRIAYHTSFRVHGVRAALTPLIARRARRVAQANLFRLTMRLAQTG